MRPNNLQRRIRLPASRAPGLRTPRLALQNAALLQAPDLISEQEMSILNQLPKRNCSKLQSTGQAPAEGWGLYYEES